MSCLQKVPCDPLKSHLKWDFSQEGVFLYCEAGAWITCSVVAVGFSSQKVAKHFVDMSSCCCFCCSCSWREGGIGFGFDSECGAFLCGVWSLFVALYVQFNSIQFL